MNSHDEYSDSIGDTGEATSPEWASVLDAVRAERLSLEAMNARVVQRVMSNLQFVDAPHPTAASPRSRAAVWRYAGAFSAACGVVLAAGLIASRSPEPSGGEVPLVIESAKVRVPQDPGVIQLKPAPDTQSLQQALEALPDGSRVDLQAVELRGGFVFRKPMTIVSQNGTTVIGRS